MLNDVSLESLQPLRTSGCHKYLPKISISEQKQQSSICSEKSVSSDDLRTIPLHESQPSHHLQLQSIRGGRYYKRQAPSPPCQDFDASSTSAIKAKLVLQPGVVKKPCMENLPKIFVSHSPSSKRRNKSASPISKLLMIPKDLKRFSWHELFLGSGQQIGAAQMAKSRSHEDFRDQFLSRTHRD